MEDLPCTTACRAAFFCGAESKRNTVWRMISVFSVHTNGVYCMVFFMQLDALVIVVVCHSEGSDVENYKRTRNSPWKTTDAQNLYVL